MIIDDGTEHTRFDFGIGAVIDDEKGLRQVVTIAFSSFSLYLLSFLFGLPETCPLFHGSE